MALEQELEFYRSQRQVLLQTHKGQFAVIKGTKLLGTYATFEEAFNAGVAAVGTEPFLIQQILEQEEVMQNPALSRRYDLCAYVTISFGTRITKSALRLCE